MIFDIKAMKERTKIKATHHMSYIRPVPFLIFIVTGTPNVKTPHYGLLKDWDIS